MFLVGIVHNYIYLLILVLEKNSMLDFIFTHWVWIYLYV